MDSESWRHFIGRCDAIVNRTPTYLDNQQYIVITAATIEYTGTNSCHS